MSAPSVALSPKISESIELNKLKSVEESIRAFVRVANPKFRQIVPMKFGNFTLSASEADAYCADYLDETSFRADNARVLVRTVAVVARISTEIEELKQKQNSLHLWKSHGESIKYLLSEAERVTIEAGRVITLAQQRGLLEKVNSITTSLQRAQSKSTEAGDLLRFLTARSEA
jgi:hypothetical protein